MDRCVLHQRPIFLYSQASHLLSFVGKEPHCLQHTVPWSLDIYSTQISPVYRVGKPGITNWGTHFCPPHNNSSVHLSTKKEGQRSGWFTERKRRGWTTLRDSAISSPKSAPIHLEWPWQEQRRFGLTASAPVSELSAPAYRNGQAPSVACKCGSEVKVVDHVVFHICSICRIWLIFSVSNGLLKIGLGQPDCRVCRWWCSCCMCEDCRWP